MGTSSIGAHMLSRCWLLPAGIRWPTLSTGILPEGDRRFAHRVLESGVAGHTLHDPGRASGADHGLYVSHSND